MKVKAMSFNLRYNNTGDGMNAWGHRTHRVRAVIQKWDPLVIGTQEGLADMLGDLEELLPGYARVGEGRRGGSEDEHTAILYKKEKLALEDWGQFWLSEEPDVPGSISWDSSLPRICTWAVFTFTDPEDSETYGRSFRMYNTHLDHRGEQARQLGAKLIWTMMRRHARDSSAGQLPVLLTGDFNAHPDSNAIRFLSGLLELDGEKSGLLDAFSLIDGGTGGSFHNFKGTAEGSPIDYVFGGFGFQPLEVTIDRSEFEGGYPSDHYPVIAVFEAKGN